MRLKKLKENHITQRQVRVRSYRVQAIFLRKSSSFLEQNENQNE